MSRLNLYHETVIGEAQPRQRLRGLKLIESVEDTPANHKKLEKRRIKMLSQGQRPVLMTVANTNPNSMNRAARRAYLRDPQIRADVRRLESALKRERVRVTDAEAEYVDTAGNPVP